MVLEIEGGQVSGKRSGESVPKEPREDRQRSGQSGVERKPGEVA